MTNQNNSLNAHKFSKEIHEKITSLLHQELQNLKNSNENTYIKVNAINSDFKSFINGENEDQKDNKREWSIFDNSLDEERVIFSVDYAAKLNGERKEFSINEFKNIQEIENSKETFSLNDLHQEIKESKETLNNLKKEIEKSKETLNKKDEKPFKKWTGKSLHNAFKVQAKEKKSQHIPYFFWAILCLFLMVLAIIFFPS